MPDLTLGQRADRAMSVDVRDAVDHAVRLATQTATHATSQEAMRREACALTANAVEDVIFALFIGTDSAAQEATREAAHA